jgi:hypothetical protein
MSDPRDADYTVAGVIATVRRSAERDMKLAEPSTDPQDIEVVWRCQGMIMACDDIAARLARGNRLRHALGLAPIEWGSDK